jgi:DNA polymerase-3 subunit delta'
MARLIDSIYGHEETWQALRARGEDLPHALAFTGPAGIGKRRVAWALAQALLCTSEEKPCGQCGPCLRVEKQQSEAVLAIEPSGTQIKLESALQVQEFLSLALLTPARIVIVNEAQLMNAQTANALLKLVEEPPPGTRFFLIVPEISQLLPTLKSRSQVVRFRPLTRQVLEQEQPSPAWMLNSARGSFERLAQFQDEDVSDLRQRAFDFLACSLRQDRSGLQALLERTKDREAALRAVRFLQQGLRDWSAQGAAAAIHADFNWAELPQTSPHRRVQLWQYAQQMESDLIGNVDRSLIFENFYYRSQHALD